MPHYAQSAKSTCNLLLRREPFENNTSYSPWCILRRTLRDYCFSLFFLNTFNLLQNDLFGWAGGCETSGSAFLCAECTTRLPGGGGMEVAKSGGTICNRSN